MIEKIYNEKLNKLKVCSYKPDKLKINIYIKKVNTFYLNEKVSSKIINDTLIMFYKMTLDERIFNLIFKMHIFLLKKIVGNILQKYNNALTCEDGYDLWSMTTSEFYRRILAYQIPQIAPFSKYIKTYMKKWVSRYAGIIANKNRKIENYIDEKNYEIGVYDA